MSVSDDQRREDRKRTLILMYREVGEHRASHVSFDADDAAVPGVLQTTWRELLDDGLIDDKRSSMGRPQYRLTSRGWLRGLIVCGDADTPETRERGARLAQALKLVVKGRKSHYDEFATVSGVAADATLPEGWIVNAIKSKLLSVLFRDDKWDAQMDGRSGNDIRVSPTFGLNHLFDDETTS